MKSIFAIFLILLISVGPSLAEVDEWHPRVVVHGRFGDALDEYGYQGIEKHSEPIELVSCFDVTAENILIFDNVKYDVKVYSIDGNYIKTIKAVQASDPLNRPVLASDIILLSGKLYLLMDYSGHPGDPSIEWSRYQIYTFDLRSGAPEQRIFVKNGDLGMQTIMQKGEQIRVRNEGGVVFVDLHDGIGLYDTDKKETFRITRNAKLVSEAEQLAGTVGWGSGETRAYQKNRAGDIEIVSPSGESLAQIQKRGMLIAVSKNNDYFAVSHARPSPSLDYWPMTIHNNQGTVIGSVMLKPASWGAFFPPTAYNLDELVMVNFSPALYRLHVGNDGVKIIRWRE
ncbi:MAG: hypothetical protein HY770_07780 [Chitinivibrionia bacterium]|nr:hypothetical protein [Chitinivibrionia bacterium]